jgi:predicted RNase H-like HicB family nuclease
MRYSVLLEAISETGFEGFYYAHIPSLGLTTQGKGVEGALEAARELAEVWLAEKRAHGETPPAENAAFFSQIDVPDAVHGA